MFVYAPKLVFQRSNQAAIRIATIVWLSFTASMVFHVSAVFAQMTNPAAVSDPAGNAVKGARWALALPGGALDEVDKIPVERRRAMEASLAAALRQGRDLLAAGGTSLDAVERVVRTLEDDPLFNAGKGAVYNAAGGHELDASIMDGKTKACGAVAGVSTVKNPVTLARLVMTRTRHVLLMGAGAERFADEVNVDRVDNR